MKPRNQVSRSAIELIKRFEGYRRKSAQLPDGRWTIGHGHTQTAREGAEVSEQDAEALLLYDLIAVSHSINEWVFTPLNQNQFDSLTAFAFNIGLENFRRSSVLRRLNEGSLIQAACAMELWRKAEFEGETIVVDALVRRRSAEKTLFLTPMNGWVPAPSPVVRPNIDLDALGVVPRQTPTALTTPMDGAKVVVERDEIQSERRVGDVLEDDQQSPAAAAAASVSSRLASIFSEPLHNGPVVEPSPRLVIDEPGPATAAFPQPAAEPAFVLTPPVEEEFAEPEAYEAPKLELVAANESEPVAEPSLFEEPPVESAPDVEAVLEPAAEELAPPADDVVSAAKRPGLAPAFGLAGAGVALFGGCLFWALNMPQPQTVGAVNPGTVVWLAGIAGVGLIGVAVYMILDRLGRPDIEHVDAVLERDE
ncbi:glycoside hydrolase family protein [Phenylobacterium sp. LjRoot164]|uniref:lysozyme n=1 Tax=unclassified Phenylobacterium TaxID=2640670 RepID=UPI003ECF86C5